MKKKRKQLKFFEDQKLWKQEWKGMPEYVQKDIKPYKSLLVHFRNLKDFNEFKKVIEQDMSPNTKYIWFPKLEINELYKYRYVDFDGKVKRKKIKKNKRSN